MINRFLSILSGALLALLAAAAMPAGEAAGIPGGRPFLLHHADDRARLLAMASRGVPGWSPGPDEAPGSLGRVLREAWYGDYERSFSPACAWEGPRAEDLRRLAFAVWLLGDRPRPGSPRADMPDLHAALRAGVASVTVPDRREREMILGPGRDRRWGPFLDAGISLWTYALAYDYLAAIRRDDPAFDDAIPRALYEKLADGAFRVLLDHMRANPLAEWDGRQGRGNNWNAREFVGVGMACLAMADRFLAEPVGSRRRSDFADALRLVRALGSGYLRGWYAGDETASYYYEGPHYLRYWAEYWIPFLDAHARLFPEAVREWPALSLAPGSPMAGYMRAQAMCIMPTHRDRDGSPRWSNPPWDDTWIYHDDALMVLPMAAAVMPLPDADRDRILGAIARAGIIAHPLLAGSPLWERLAATRPAELPRAECLPRSGIAMLRSGPGGEDLHVALKNAPVEMAGGTPSLASHCHSDCGSVTAFRDFEPVLIDPGYGAKGWGNPQHARWFTAWNRHNLLLVDDGAGYGADIRAAIDETGPFVLPVWGGAAAADARRVSGCVARRDACGDLAMAEMATPAHRRLVLLPDRDHILVVDRLQEPRRVKLCWWGNGHAGDGGASTAAIDPATATAIWSRGPRTATRVRVLLPSPQRTTTAAGMYGPFWYDLSAAEAALTGMWVESSQPVGWAITLVEIAAHDAAPAAFTASAEPVLADGALAGVVLRSAGGAVRYDLAGDGTVARRSGP